VQTKPPLRPPISTILLGAEEEAVRITVPGWGHAGWSSSEAVDVYSVHHGSTPISEAHISVIPKPFSSGAMRACFWGRNNSKNPALFPDHSVLVLKENKLRGRGNNSRDAIYTEFIDVSGREPLIVVVASRVSSRVPPIEYVGEALQFDQSCFRVCCYVFSL